MTQSKKATGKSETEAKEGQGLLQEVAIGDILANQQLKESQIKKG